MAPADEARTAPLWKTWGSKANKQGEHCTVYWVAGSRYTGEWQGNLKHGKGVLHYKNADKYEGEFANDVRSGHGTYWVYESGKYRVEYSGSWLQNEKNGFGVFYNAKGERYEGEWLNGRRHGKGKQTYGGRIPDGFGGDLYDGEWQNDKRSGEGTYFYANGDVFKGGWLDDAKHGEGTYFYEKTGKRYDGVWEKGVAKCGTYQPTDPADVPATPPLELLDAEKVAYDACVAKLSQM